MNRFHYYRNRAILLFTLAVPLLFSTACNDFFGTADLKEEIQREVAVATADEVTAIVKADPSTGGNLSVIGEIK